MKDYQEFIKDKYQNGCNSGFEPYWIPDGMFDFQKNLTEWAIRTGRSALIEDCGLGKTYQELVWSKNVAKHTGKPVLNITPLAVSLQTTREAEKFGIDAYRSIDGTIKDEVVITNYEKLHFFHPYDFGGVVC